jgi:hypothetical protein
MKLLILSNNELNCVHDSVTMEVGSYTSALTSVTHSLRIADLYMVIWNKHMKLIERQFNVDQ